ncbi:hypothetical protein EC973_008677 [Apophysomyces ossiformis]|uniref:Uncharacterized protein n=1 Tax=Apophysomyces ossiformis TaxID=679940 RepID=A0A8H7BN90_9FUNG|nr:hypothetical protein EC973_008677 [Apophysomyces ossiformis]
MSYRSYHHYTETSTEDGVETTTTSLVVRELDDVEAQALLAGHTLDSLTPNMLKSPPQYEITDEVDNTESDAEEEEDEDEEEEDEDEEIEEHWFPSLLKESMIEFLEEEDTPMLDGHEILLDSEEDAQIEEREEKQPKSKEQARAVPIEIICLDY